MGLGFVESHHGADLTACVSSPPPRVQVSEGRSRRVGRTFPEQADESKDDVSLITDLEAKKKAGLNVFWCFKPLENPMNQVAEPSERF